MDNFQDVGPGCDRYQGSACISCFRLYLEDMTERTATDEIGIELEFPPVVGCLSHRMFRGAIAAFDLHAHPVEIGATIIIIDNMAVEYKNIFTKLCITGHGNVRTKR